MPPCGRTPRSIFIDLFVINFSHEFELVPVFESVICNRKLRGHVASLPFRLGRLAGPPLGSRIVDQWLGAPRFFASPAAIGRQRDRLRSAQLRPLYVADSLFSAEGGDDCLEARRSVAPPRPTLRTYLDERNQLGCVRHRVSQPFELFRCVTPQRNSTCPCNKQRRLNAAAHHF